MHILILEDSAENAEGLKRLLELEGWTAKKCGTLDEACGALLTGPVPAVLVVDYSALEGRGLAPLRALTPAPIVVFTGIELESVAHLRADGGARKPFSADLIAEIRRVTSKEGDGDG